MQHFQKRQHQGSDLVVELGTSAAAAKEVPGLEDVSLQIEGRLGDLSSRAAGHGLFEQFLEVAFEMSPAELTLKERVVVVDAPAIAAQDARESRAEQLSQSDEIAQAIDEKHSQVRRGGHPQPAFAAGLFPTGLVEMFDIGLSHGFDGFGMCRSESFAEFAFEIGDGAERDGRLKRSLKISSTPRLLTP